VLTLPPRILLARDPVDFRKQIDGLAAVCEVHLGEQPLGGTLFVFRNSRATALKMLVWSHGGFTLLYKKLERGQFAWPKPEGDRVCLSQAELVALLEGIDLSKCVRLKRWTPTSSLPNSDGVG
jgi:transposase